MLLNCVTGPFSILPDEVFHVTELAMILDMGFPRAFTDTHLVETLSSN